MKTLNCFKTVPVSKFSLIRLFFCVFSLYFDGLSEQFAKKMNPVQMSDSEMFANYPSTVVINSLLKEYLFHQSVFTFFKVLSFFCILET